MSDKESCCSIHGISLLTLLKSKIPFLEVRRNWSAHSLIQSNVGIQKKHNARHHPPAHNLEATQADDEIHADSGRVDADVRSRRSLAQLPPHRTARTITPVSTRRPAGEPCTADKAEGTRGALTTRVTHHTTGADFQRAGSNHSASNLTPGISGRDGP